MPLTTKNRIDVTDVTGITQEQRSNTVTAKLFHTIFLLLKVSGVFIDREDSSKLKLAFSYVYCALVALVYITDAMRLSAIHNSERFHHLSSSQAASVLVLNLDTWNITILCTGQLYLLTKHVDSIRRTVDSYEKLYSIDTDVKTLKKRRIKLIATKVIGVIFNAVTMASLLTILPEESIFMTLLYGFKYVSYSEKLVPISWVTFKMSLETFANACIISFFHEFVTILVSEYESITRKFDALIQEDAITDVEVKLEHYRRQHQALTDLLDTANPFIQFYVLVSLAFGLPCICFLVYGVATGGLMTMDFIFLVYILVSSLLGLMYITWMGARLHLKAHTMRDLLFRLNMNLLPKSAIHQVQIFIAQVNGPPIGISVYGMIVMDASSILTLVGTILTYSIVIFQTSVPTQCTCNTAFVNTTL